MIAASAGPADDGAELFYEMANGLPLIVWVHDEAGEQVMVNDTFCEFFGVSRDEMKGGRWQMLMHPDDADAYTAEFLACVRDRRPFHSEVRVRRADGQWRWLESWARPRFSEDGQFRGMVGTSADTTDRKRFEDELARANQRKDEYLAMLGHELRNPLAAIQNAAELLALTTIDDSTIARAAGVLGRQADHMARLIDGLLEVSRIARGKIELNRRTVDLRVVCEHVLGDHSGLVSARGRILETDLPAEPLWVSADPVRLVQVIDNLVGNAVKFTPPHGRVAIALRREGSCAVLRVRDDGVGIRPENLELIFEPFHQEQQDVARRSGGLGLGLALSKGLVELHGGTIEARSRGPGHGAELTVRVPLAAAPPVTADAPPAVEVRARKVLIIEDNADAAQMLLDLLAVQGHDVAVAEHGAEGLAVLRRDRKDIVLCDIGLPGMSGYEFARTVRAAADLRDVTLVALTGYGQPEDRERTAEAGFDAHLTKPVSLDELGEILRQV